MNKSLFQIEFDYLKLVSEIEELGGELTEDIVKKLEITKEDFEKKFKQYYYVVQALTSDIGFLNDRQKEFGNQINTKNNIINRLQERQKDALKLFGEKTDKGGYKYKFDDLSTWLYDLDAVQVKDEQAFGTYINEQLKILIDTGKTELDMSIYTLVMNIETANLKIINKIIPILKEDKVIGKITVKYSKESVKSAIDSGKVFDHFHIRKSTVLRYK